MQAKCLVSCNDGSGADHLRQRELIDFGNVLQISGKPEGDILKTSSSNSYCSEPSRESNYETNGCRHMSDADVRKSRCHLNGVLRKNVILSENNKCPPPIFTRNQRKLVVQAWKHVHTHIQEVQIFSRYFSILTLFILTSHFNINVAIIFVFRRALKSLLNCFITLLRF